MGPHGPQESLRLHLYGLYGFPQSVACPTFKFYLSPLQLFPPPNPHPNPTFQPYLVLLISPKPSCDFCWNPLPPPNFGCFEVPGLLGSLWHPLGMGLTGSDHFSLVAYIGMIFSAGLERKI